MLPFALIIRPAFGPVHVGVRHQGCNLRDEFVFLPLASGRFKALERSHPDGTSTLFYIPFVYPFICF